MKRALLICSLFILSFNLFANDDEGVTEKEAYLNQFKDQSKVEAELIQKRNQRIERIKYEQTKKEQSNRLLLAQKAKDPEELLNDIENESAEVIKTAESMQVESEPAQNEIPTQMGGIDPKLLKEKGGLKKLLQTMLVPYSKMSQAEIEEHLLKALQQKKADQFFRKFPIFLTFLAKLFKDKDALPEIATILEDRETLLIYGGFFLSTFFVAFLLRRLFAKIEIGFFKSFFTRLLLLNILRLGGFCYLFSEPLSPLWRIIKSTFF